MSDIRRDYGPQGCAERSAKMIGIFGVLSLLVVRARKIRRTR